MCFLNSGRLRRIASCARRAGLQPALEHAAPANPDPAAASLRAAKRLQRALRKGKKSPIETMYRHFWHRKGDVFHLLLNLALVLDNR